MTDETSKKPEEIKEDPKAEAKTEEKSEVKDDKKADEPKKAISAAARKKAKHRITPLGKAYIQASYNNTIVTITEPNGNVLAWSSSGSNNFKGARKATPYAAQISAEAAVEKAKVFGLEKVTVFVKGVGTGRDQAVRGLVNAGLDILSITDTTPIPHNGCRKKKQRRV